MRGEMEKNQVTFELYIWTFLREHSYSFFELGAVISLRSSFAVRGAVYLESVESIRSLRSV
jgi:hypothetical protein